MKFKYEDEVIVTKGFYINQKGKVINYNKQLILNKKFPFIHNVTVYRVNIGIFHVEEFTEDYLKLAVKDVNTSCLNIFSFSPKISVIEKELNKKKVKKNGK